MTNAEMNRRLSTLTEAKLVHLKRMAWASTYTARELVDICRVKLATINAVIRLVEQEASK